MVMRLSISVLLTDDLTGAPIKGSSARVWIDGQKPPIKKNDGRSIFVDLPEGEYLLHAEGGFYAHTEVRCRVTSDKAENITIRLIPNRLYPLPSDTVRIEGRTVPGSVVRVYSSDRSSAYKLLSDVKKGDSVIGIYHGAGINIEGKLLKIISPDDKTEYIRVLSAENSERSEYLLSGELKASFPKIGTVIVPVSECEPDADGNVTILVKKGSGGSEMICEIQNGKKITEKKINISGSNCIKADLTK